MSRHFADLSCATDGLIKEGIVARPFLDDEVEELTDADARRLAKEYLKTVSRLLSRSRHRMPGRMPLVYGCLKRPHV